MEQTLKFKAISSMEKCFYDDDIDKFPELSEISMLKNEKVSFQLAFRETDNAVGKRFVSLYIDGELKKYISVKQTVCVPSVKPVEVQHHNYDENYLRTTAGLYPDLIEDLHYDGKIVLSVENLRTFWLDINLPEDFKGGEYPLTFTLINDGCELATTSLKVTVVDKKLPETEIPHTEWFYCDCLAQFYHTRVFSERFWNIVGNFIKTAVDNGINTIMTPIFTPALDTYIGGERLTVQLVDISLNNGKYSFDFTKLDRWIEMCRSLGVKYLELPPFYTQWGAKATPKIVVSVDGKRKKLFGWHTDSMGEAYKEFLDAFLPELKRYFVSKGMMDKVFIHISDEPNLSQLDLYEKTGRIIKKHMKGFTIIDAVSNVEVYNKGILETPVVSVGHMHEFIDAGADKAWVYYCCGPTRVYTNRFMAMPSARTRILGVQMYKFNIKGFLHWGYNFCNTQFSYAPINPYIDTTGEYFAPSGDCFLVYPGKEGVPEESIRLKQMRDAFQDIRALTLLEKHRGRDFVISMIDEGLDTPLTFDKYPKSADYILDLRAKVNKALAEI